MNRKGFTLIELLGVIVIIGLIVGLSTFGIIKIYNNAKDRSFALTEKNILSAANTYANEKISDDDYWQRGETHNYFCITVKELINLGLLKEKKIDSNIINNYVAVIKNNITLSLEDSKLLPKNTTDVEEGYEEAFSVCSGNYIYEEITSLPEITGNTTYTDEVDASFKDATTSSNIIEKYCAYGDNSQFLKYTGTINGDKCQVEGLKQDTDYYAKVCMKTDKNSILCSQVENLKTKKVKAPSIAINNNNIKITYNDTGIKEPFHYFKSSKKGTANANVHKCTLENNIFTCDNESSRDITAKTWYRVDEKNIEISYDTQIEGNITVNARTTDKTNNYKNKKFEFSKYVITFVENDTSSQFRTCLATLDESCNIYSPASTRSGYTLFGWTKTKGDTISQWAPDSDVPKSVNASATYYAIWGKEVKITFKGNGNGASDQTLKCTLYNDDTSCKIKSPTSSRTGYTFIGWNTSNSATSSQWNANVEKNVNASATYYAIWAKDITITFKGNGNGASDQTNKCTMYNNASSCTVSFPTSTRTGYTFVGWNVSNSATTGISSGDYSVSANATYYAIWKKNIKLTFDGNGGSVAESDKEKTCGIFNNASNCTVKFPTPTRSGYTFVAWNTSTSATTGLSSGNHVVSTSAKYYAIWMKTKTINDFDNANSTVSHTKTLDDFRAINSITVDNGTISSYSYNSSEKKLYYTVTGGTSTKTGIKDSIVSSRVVPSGSKCKDGSTPKNTGYCYSGEYKKGGSGWNKYNFECKNTNGKIVWISTGVIFTENISCSSGETKNIKCDGNPVITSGVTDCSKFGVGEKTSEQVRCQAWCKYDPYYVKMECPSGTTPSKYNQTDCYSCSGSCSLKEVDNQYKCQCNYYDYVVTIKYFVK